MARDNSRELSTEDFNTAVIAELKDRGRPEVAQMSKEYDSGMACMSSATVAGEEGLPLLYENVAEVADAREWWYDEHHSQHEHVEA